MALARSFLRAAFFPAFAASLARAAFTFSFNDPTSCDDLTISWSGGQAPFSLNIIPVFGNPWNISIPASAVSNGNGTFKTQLLIPENKTFVTSMSDATGFGTGGMSDVLTAGKSTSGASCNTTYPAVDFDFEANLALQQCRTFTFEGYTGAVQPVHILGIVPGGSYIQMNPPKGATSFDWTADVTAGQSMIFIMYDSQGRQGGSSDIRTVGASDDTTCLDKSAPSSTANPPIAVETSTTSTSATSTSTETTPADSDHTGAGAIAGTVIGILIGIAAVASLAIFLLQRRRANRRWPYRGRNRRHPSVDLLGKSGNPGQGPVSHVYAYPYPTTAPIAPGEQPIPYGDVPPSDAGGTSPFLQASPYDPEPYRLQSTTPDEPSDSTDRSRHASMSTTTSRAARKAAMAGVSPYDRQATRFVLHTDLEEVQPDENGVVELPPQYTPGRAPMTRLPPGLAAVSEDAGAPQLPPPERTTSPFGDEHALGLGFSTPLHEAGSSSS